jgi:hypothetical protein
MAIKRSNWKDRDIKEVIQFKKSFLFLIIYSIL